MLSFLAPVPWMFIQTSTPCVLWGGATEGAARTISSGMAAITTNGRLTLALPRVGVVDELQANGQHGLLESFGQARERVGLGDGPHGDLIVRRVAGALADGDALELSVSRDLEDDLGLVALDGAALPTLLDLPVNRLDVPGIWEVGDVEGDGAGPLGRARGLAERRRWRWRGRRRRGLLLGRRRRRRAGGRDAWRRWRLLLARPRQR